LFDAPRRCCGRPWVNQVVATRGENAASLPQKEDGLNGDVIATGQAAADEHDGSGDNLQNPLTLTESPHDAIEA